MAIISRRLATDRARRRRQGARQSHQGAHPLGDRWRWCWSSRVVGGRLIQLGIDRSPTRPSRAWSATSSPRRVRRSSIATGSSWRSISACRRCSPSRAASSMSTRRCEALRTVLPDLDRGLAAQAPHRRQGLRLGQARTDAGASQDRIMRLGIPGIDFVTESKRFYPGGTEASHILGAVNIDNQGIAGIEKHMDGEDVALLQSHRPRARQRAGAGQSLDRPARPARHARAAGRCADPLQGGRGGRRDARHQDRRGHRHGLAAGFRSQQSAAPRRSVRRTRFNRITSGIFELGSTFKTDHHGRRARQRQGRASPISSTRASASASAASPSTISTASTAC